MPSLFSSVASRGRGISKFSTCVKGGVIHIVNIDFELLALITFISSFITAVDNSAICTNGLFCGILSLFGVAVAV